MLPCLYTHFSHKARTATLKLRETREQMEEQGASGLVLSRLIAAIAAAVDVEAAIYTSKCEVEKAVAFEKATNRAKRQAEQQARTAAKVAKQAAAQAPRPSQELVASPQAGVLIHLQNG